MNLTWKARTDPFMKWFTFTLFLIWLIVGVVWLASSLKDARRKFTQSLNTKQRRLSWVFVALFVLSLFAASHPLPRAGFSFNLAAP